MLLFTRGEIRKTNGSKMAQELLDNDFISFWLQCLVTLQVVQGADVFVPLILAF